VFVGDLEGAIDTESLQKCNITHVVTCGPLELPWCAHNDEQEKTIHTDAIGVNSKATNLQHLILDALFDIETCDIRGMMKDSVHFAQGALQEPDTRVLFHCLAGQSRSVAMCISLLVSSGITVNEAIKRVRTIHPTAAPNEGFIRQLNDYCRQLGHDTDSPATKSDVVVTFSCKACRNVLFTNVNVVDHPCVERSSKKRTFRGSSACTSLFVEPMSWMGELSGQDGKMSCPNKNCGSKIGNWSWHGIRCSCGAWHTPAFQVPLSKVDRMQSGSTVAINLPCRNDNLAV